MNCLPSASELHNVSCSWSLVCYLNSQIPRQGSSSSFVMTLTISNVCIRLQITTIISNSCLCDCNSLLQELIPSALLSKASIDTRLSGLKHSFWTNLRPYFAHQPSTKLWKTTFSDYYQSFGYASFVAHIAQRMLVCEFCEFLTALCIETCSWYFSKVEMDGLRLHAWFLEWLTDFEPTFTCCRPSVLLTDRQIYWMQFSTK